MPRVTEHTGVVVPASRIRGVFVSAGLHQLADRTGYKFSFTT